MMRPSIMGFIGPYCSTTSNWLTRTVYIDVMVAKLTHEASIPSTFGFVSDGFTVKKSWIDVIEPSGGRRHIYISNHIKLPC